MEAAKVRILKEETDTPERAGFGLGRDRLYRLIKQKYPDAAISWRDVYRFLQNSEDYQLHQFQRKRDVHQPIAVNYPHTFYQMDLIDLHEYSSVNDRKKFALNVIDVFSKYVWSRLSPNKEKPTVQAALNDILEAFPKKKFVIQSDNGSEFKNLQLPAESRQIFSQAYKPTSNSIIERFNRSLKKLIHLYMTKNDTRRYVDVYSQSIRRALQRDDSHHDQSKTC